MLALKFAQWNGGFILCSANSKLFRKRKNKHKEAGKAITKYVSEYLYKRTGISKINFDQAQSKFRQVRLLAEQQTPVTLNKAPFEFSYKLITKKRV